VSCVAVVQPPHWLVDLAVVSLQLDSELIPQAVSFQRALELPDMTGVEVCRNVCEHSIALNQRLFDSLDHPVALTTPGGA
jgi:hypothetical protein